MELSTGSSNVDASSNDQAANPTAGSLPYPRGVLLDAVKDAASISRQNELQVEFDVANGSRVLLAKNFVVPIVGFGVFVAAFVFGDSKQTSGQASKVTVAPLVVGCGILFVFSVLGLLHACTAVKNQQCTITSTQIVLKTHSLIRCETRIPLIRVSEVHLHQGFLDKLFQVTNLAIDTTPDGFPLYRDDEYVTLLRAVRYPLQVLEFIHSKREDCRDPPIFTLRQPLWIGYQASSPSPSPPLVGTETGAPPVSFVVHEGTRSLQLQPAQQSSLQLVPETSLHQQLIVQRREGIEDNQEALRTPQATTPGTSPAEVYVTMEVV